MEKSIYELAVEQMEGKDIDHHSSDLYLRKNDISTLLVNSYEYKQNVKTFTDNIDHVTWYDIPFAYSNK